MASALNAPRIDDASKASSPTHNAPEATLDAATREQELARARPNAGGGVLRELALTQWRRTADLSFPATTKGR